VTLARYHLRMAGRFAAHRLRRLHPFEVQASVQNACNLRCTYCRCPEERMPLLSTAEWTAMLTDLGRLGTLRVKFQGGEPTLRRDLPTLCAVAQRAGIRTAVVTNGLQFKARPELFDHLDEVVFSLDSVRPAYTDCVRGAGVHAGVLEAIELAGARPVRVFINMVVTRDNVVEVEPMLAFCERRGIGLHVQPVVFGRKYYDDAARPLALDDAELRELHHRLAALKRAGRPLMFAASSYARVAAWDDFGEITRRSAGESPCMAGRFYVHIEPNGDVHPCGQHGAAFTPRNAVHDGLEVALAHAQHHDCGACFSAYLNERKAVFALRPSALLQVARRG
jgi:pyrroloquinoline quinone biosynthesis protein E